MASRSFVRSRIFRCAVVVSFCLGILWVSRTRAQELSPDSLADARKSEAPISARDLAIPPKALENYQQGLQHLDKQDPTGSVTYFSKAIKKFPAYYEAYYHLGVAQKRLGQDDLAMKSFQSAIDLSGGKYALAEFAYGLLLCKQGKTAEAERVVRYGLNIDKDETWGYVVLGTVLLSLNRFEEAEKSAREALALNQSSPDAYLVLAGINGQRYDYSSEVSYLNDFLRLESSGPRADAVRGIRDIAQRLAADQASKR